MTSTIKSQLVCMGCKNEGPIAIPINDTKRMCGFHPDGEFNPHNEHCSLFTHIYQKALGLRQIDTQYGGKEKAFTYKLSNGSRAVVTFDPTKVLGAKDFTLDGKPGDIHDADQLLKEMTAQLDNNPRG